MRVHSCGNCVLFCDSRYIRVELFSDIRTIKLVMWEHLTNGSLS